MQDKVSICAVVCRNLPDLMDFYYSVKWNTDLPYEIVLVDNGTTGEVKNFIDEVISKDPTVRLIRNEINLGIGKGMNQAMKAASTDYIFRCDTDIIVSKNWTSGMMKYIEQFPEVGQVGTLFTGGLRKCTGKFMETDFMNSSCVLIPRKTIEAIALKLAGEGSRIITAVEEEILKIGNNLPYPKKIDHLRGVTSYIQNDAGYWDSSFPYGADDMDYSLAVRYAGLKLVIAQDVLVLHKQRSMEKQYEKERDELVREGFQYYRTKWEKILDYYGEPYTTGGWTDMWRCLPINKEYLKDIRSWEMYYPEAVTGRFYK